MTLSKRAHSEKDLRKVMADTVYVLPEPVATCCPVCGSRMIVEYHTNEHGDHLQRFICKKGHFKEKYAAKVDEAGGVATMVIPDGAIDICRKYAALHGDSVLWRR